MSVDERKLEAARKPGFGLGLLKGMAVTLKHLFKHNTVIQYPDEKQDLPARTRGVIALKEENCTVCMLCGRECPDWCIYIDSHKETLPPKREGGRPRKRNVLDRFAIDYALCMYCGICVEVCPYDALFWSREFEYAEYDIRQLTHEKEKLSDWMASVLPPPALEEGAELPGAPTEPATAAGAAGPGSAQRPSPPAQDTAVEERPQQAARPPEAAAASAPPEAQATDAQRTAGETQPDDARAAEAPTEQKSSAVAGAPASAEAEQTIGTADDQPDAIKSEAEQTPSKPERREAEAVAEPQAASASRGAPTAAATPIPAEPGEEPQAVYERVLQEQRDKGSSPQVAEARAKVARVKAERGLRASVAPAPAAEPVPSAPQETRPAEPEPSGAPEATEPRPEQGPVAPTETEAVAAEPEAAAPPETEDAAATAQPEAAAPTETEDEAATAEPEAKAAQPSGDAGGEDPDAVYDRVLAEEKAKGSSDAVATGRAKAARVRAQKGTRGPGE